MQNFGTDGIRGKAEQFTPEFLAKIIRGLVDYADRDDFKIFLAGDTRESSEWIIRDLETACETFGVEFSSAGVLPTPAINFCFAKMGFNFAIDVTASHNPFTDNGIKVFELGSDGRGQKLSEEGRAKIEASLKTDISYSPVALSDRADISLDAQELYKEHLENYLGSISDFINNPNDETSNIVKNTDSENSASSLPDFHGFHLGIDCANGATSVINKSIFEKLGANVELINCCKNYNTEINKDCGSTHLESLRKLVLEQHLDFGVAFDGDGDRVLMIDETGAEVDGDHLVAILTDFLKLDSLAVTVMTNQGLLNWAKSENLKLEITPVGDINIAAAMLAGKAKIGSEQNGHLIPPGQTSGDGMLTALLATKVISETKKSLHELAAIIKKLPQITINIPADPTQKENLNSDTVKKLLSAYDEKLKAEKGRLLVRPSGTENLIRITMWGESEEFIKNLIEELKIKLGEIL